MTNLITLTIPNDDHVALRAFGKALEEMALAHGASPTQLQVVNEITMSDKQRETLAERLLNLRRSHSPLRSELEAKSEPEVDTTSEQFAALAKMESAESEQPAKGFVQTEDGQFNLSTGAQVDSSGTPWDERIHSASKALNSDGTWRLRRKPKDMDETEWAALVESVKAELVLMVQGCAMYDEQVIMEEDSHNSGQEAYIALAKHMIEPPVTPPGDDFHTDAVVVTEQTVAGIPPIPVPPPVVVPPVPREVSTETLSKALDVPYGEPEQWDFPKLMKFLTERHGEIDVPTVNQLLAVDGLTALTDLNAHPDKIGSFVARVKAHLGE